jgi:argininosuccinate lyase
MQHEFCRPNKPVRNTRILKTICIVLPMVTLAAAHWFPWKRYLHRDLNRFECYAIGTGAIVGTAALAIAASEGDRDDHVVMLGFAAVSAGVTTLLANASDYVADLRGELAKVKGQLEALVDRGEIV